MPVTIKSHNVESWSTRKAKEILNPETFMKLNRVTITGWKPGAFTSRKIKTLKTNEAKIVPLPIMLVADLDNEFLASPLIKNPIKGKRGTR